MISDSKLLASAAWDAQSLNELKAKAGEDPAANIRPVARQVEGMFVQMMLKSMREALPKDGVFSSDSTRLYTSMYDQQIAQQMTAGKGLGLAEMMVKQMTQGQGQPADDAPQPHHADPGVPGSQHYPGPAEAEVSQGREGGVPQSDGPGGFQ